MQDPITITSFFSAPNPLPSPSPSSPMLETTAMWSTAGLGAAGGQALCLVMVCVPSNSNSAQHTADTQILPKMTGTDTQNAS